jgi:hypothetical protein
VVRLNIALIVRSESFYDLYIGQICNGCQAAILLRQEKERKEEE